MRRTVPMPSGHQRAQGPFLAQNVTGPGMGPGKPEPLGLQASLAHTSLHVLLLLLMVLLLTLQVLLQEQLVLLAQQLDLAQQVMILFLQVPLETGQQLKHTSACHTVCDPRVPPLGTQLPGQGHAHRDMLLSSACENL